MKLKPTGRPFPFLGERFEVFDDSGAPVGAVYAPAPPSSPRETSRRRVALAIAFGVGLVAGAAIGPAAAATIRVVQPTSPTIVQTH